MSDFQRKVEELLMLLRLEKRWQKVARALAVVVVFCTTYMLILPAITMENITYCNLEEHTHSESCYSSQTGLDCGLKEHTHEEYCYIKELSTYGNALNIDNAVSLMAEMGDDYSVSALAVDYTAQRINYDSLDGSGETYYIIYTNYNNRYYAVDGNGKAVAVTVGSDGSVTSDSMGENIFWSFSHQSGSAYIIQNLGTSRHLHSYYTNSSDYGVTTGGAWSSTLTTSGSGSNKTFIALGNNNYPYATTSSGTVTFNRTTSSSTASRFYLAKVTIPEVYHVWFDGTCGGLMSLYEADNTYVPVAKNDSVIKLPTTWKSPSKYDYVINGWYDIKNHTYHKPGDTVTVTKDTVFYADWVAKTYDIGQNNEHVVPSLDTNSFIRTDMFDYSAVFNFQAVTHTGTVSAGSHSETWSIVQNANVPYNNVPSLGFIFRDWDSGNRHISYAANRARLNDNQGKEITSEIIEYVQKMSGKDIIDVLFNPETDVIGKTHVGQANYLYQFMEENSSNYDGVHNGYYYYDATLNAASYNRTDERFYIYDYLERTSDSYKDGIMNQATPAAGGYSDFLPFNSPYVNNSNNKTIKDYQDKNGNSGNYQYDAKATSEQSAAGNAGTNYWFGMKSEIEFYLPNDTGTVDAYGNYGNISSHGDHMNFQFHGDDDLWVFIDGKLVMDVGGLHGIMNGKIDFSTGIVTTDGAKNNDLTSTPTSSSLNLTEGDHTLTIYYMERGGSQSNCAIYFNISPRYAMEITKQDAVTGEKLDGAEFSVFTDAACTVPATLWHSEADYEDGKESTNVFTVENGKAYFWGVSAGKLYYIKETKAPDGYPLTDDIIRVAMNNLGGSVCTTDSLRGENEEHTDGFDILSSSSDEALHLISVIITNQVEQPEEEKNTTSVKVIKQWAEGSSLPESVTVNLTADGVDTGKIAVLNEENGWTYIWTELPINNDGVKISYSVRETQVPGFTVSVSQGAEFKDKVEWTAVPALRDGDVFILTNAATGNALSVQNGKFTWISKQDAENSSAAQWQSIADGMGFHLINGDGYKIILNGTSSFVPTQDGNRILYYYDSKLFAQNSNTYYYFGSDGAASSEDGLEFVAYKSTGDGLSGTQFEITNTPIPKDNLTSFSVSKTWSDGEALHGNDSVTIRLMADGEFTGRTVELNKDNGWSASFDGLAFENEDGVKIDYTVEEESFSGYLPEYSVVTETEGKTEKVWTEVTALEVGKVYRFTANNRALACSGNNIASAAINENDAYQQWEVVSYNGNLKLKNLGNNRYLYYYRSLSTNTTYTNNYTNVTFTSGSLRIGNSSNRYITLGTGSASTTTSSSNATTFTALTESELISNPSYTITVNNKVAGYVLPATGGIGVYPMYIAGVALIVISIFLLYKKRKKY